ncbi:hypothetical protein K458DRAFT_306522 [Lentithecium fluviatile CBS 122367]|uniref:Uncharacterized protein n=1 Tax=Lentithecium fluviatile CBS 122367 TaxID=1168545 RepID=A0A6G1IWR4_9PLEO|nr:hypothetical protein K458DRAFT_306522 [Lentithecium fluviatile CBS 122367]
MLINIIPANGLIKCLLKQKYKVFLKQLRIEDISYLIRVKTFASRVNALYYAR